MRRAIVGFVGMLVVAGSVGFGGSGGWAVVTVSKVPDAWVAGKPLQLSWQVRQHGREALRGLKPTVEARSGRRVVRAETWAFDGDGEPGYRARVTFPEPGDWQVTINSGFGRSRAVLLPWPVLDSVTPVRGTVEEHLEARGVRPLSQAEQGRRLFVAKGCITCHVHRAVKLETEIANFGPDLTDRRFPADYLRRFLADPSIKPSVAGREMPNLRLREKDIVPIVAFINQSGVTARR